VTFDNHRSGDFAVYIFASKNHGDSWSKITNGIPASAGTVHVIREDPANSNLLFAGTEFGLYVSFNRGQNWERMKNGLPTVPVFDLQIHPARARPDPGDAWPLHLDHGQHQRVGRNRRQRKRADDRFASVRAEGPGVEWKTASYRGFLGTGLFMASNPQSGLLLDYYAKAPGQVRVTVRGRGWE
jgi:hypothetical protein